MWVRLAAAASYTFSLAATLSLPPHPPFTTHLPARPNSQPTPPRSRPSLSPLTLSHFPGCTSARLYPLPLAQHPVQVVPHPTPPPPLLSHAPSPSHRLLSTLYPLPPSISLIHTHTLHSLSDRARFRLYPLPLSHTHTHVGCAPPLPLSLLHTLPLSQTHIHVSHTCTQTLYLSLLHTRLSLSNTHCLSLSLSRQGVSLANALYYASIHFVFNFWLLPLYGAVWLLPLYGCFLSTRPWPDQ